MSQLQVIDTVAPGGFGINTELPPGNLPLQFARMAYNCVVGITGRLTSRKGLVSLTATQYPAPDPTSLPSFPNPQAPTGTPPSGIIGSMYETILPDGGSSLVVAGGTSIKQLKFATYAWVDMTPTAAPTAPYWQFQSFNDKLVGTQVGHAPEGWTVSAGGEWVSAPITMPTGYDDEAFSVCHAAFGRMWMANGPSTKDTVFGSDLLNAHDFGTAGSSGAIDLDKVWANGQDEVVAISSHAGYLIIFGTKQTVLFQAPDDLAITGFSLVEVIKNVGCIAKESVVTIGDDIVWAAQQGMVSLGRLLQEKGLPMGNISRNVHFDFLDTIVTSQFKVSAAFDQANENIIVIDRDTNAWVFNTRKGTPDGAAITTRWDQFPTKMHSICRVRGGTLYFGGEDGNIYFYAGYGSSSNHYTMRYYSGSQNFGNTSGLIFLKKLAFVLRGAGNQAVTFKWAFDYSSNYAGATAVLGGGQQPSFYGIGEYTVAEYAGGVQIDEVRVAGNRSGKLLQFGLETEINGNEVSILGSSVFVTPGKLA